MAEQAISRVAASEGFNAATYLLLWLDNFFAGSILIDVSHRQGEKLTSINVDGYVPLHSSVSFTFMLA